MLLPRFLGIILIFGTITACNQVQPGVSKKLVVGVIGYGEADRSLDQYSDLQSYLGIELKSIIEIEPVYNEIQALDKLAKQEWDLAFTPPGLTAIAIRRHQYKAIIPLEGIEELRSAIVVNQDSSLENIKDLTGKTIALGQEGSATNYYLPIYNLYGLALKKVRFSSTPQISLKWLEQREVDAAALSLQEFNQYRLDFPQKQFRIIDVDAHTIPSGAIIIADKIKPEQAQVIQNVLAQAPSNIAASANFLPNEPVPRYEYLTKVIERVIPISERIKEQPALFYDSHKSLAK